MPLFRKDLMLTSKCSSYLFRRTQEPHLHSFHNVELIYLLWIVNRNAKITRSYKLKPLLFYRFNIPFSMHCCSVISHIYFYFTVKLWGFAHAFLPANLHIPGKLTQIGVKGYFPRAGQHTILKYNNKQWGDACIYLPVVLLRVFLWNSESQRFVKCLIWQSTLDRNSQ